MIGMTAHDSVALLDRNVSRRRFLSRAAMLLAIPSALGSWETLAGTSVAAAASSLSVTMIGDSLTAGSLPYQQAAFLAAGFSSGVVNGYGSRGIATKVTADPYTGLTAVDALRTKHGDTPYWVVALGTNDSGIYGSAKYADLIRRMMDAIGTGHRVMWVNIYLPTLPTRQANWNAALATVAAERDGEMVVYDWASIAAQHTGWLSSDRIHYTGTGYSQRSTAVAGVAWAMVPTTASVTATSDTTTTSASTRTAATRVTTTTPVATRVGDPAGFVPITPLRALDSRVGSQRWAAQEHRTVDLSAHMPAGATAVALDVAVVDPTADAYVTLVAAGSAAATGTPSVASVSGRRNRTIAGHAVVALSTAGAVDVYAHTATDVVLDVYGWYVDGGASLHTVTPQRVLDTRTLATAPAAGDTVTIDMPTVDGAVPVAAVVNIAATEIEAAGYVTAWPAGAERPLASVLNVTTDDVAIANLAQVALDGAGRMSVRSSAKAALVVDLVALYVDGNGGRRLQAIEPLRLLDTRDGTGGWSGALAAGQTIDVPAPLDGGSAAACVLGTVTATPAAASGWLSVWSGEGTWPGTASANLSTARNASNAVLTTTSSTAGTLTVSQGGGGGEHLVVDASAVFV